MAERHSVLAQLKRVKRHLQRRYPISDIWLFGSVARGEFRAEGDVNIMVEVIGPIGFGFIDLEDELEDILGEKVSLVSKRGLKPRAFDAIKKDLIFVR